MLQVFRVSIKSVAFGNTGLWSNWPPAPGKINFASMNEVYTVHIF